mgnify:FL=1|jgi:hypothetical protein
MSKKSKREELERKLAGSTPAERPARLSIEERRAESSHPVAGRRRKPPGLFPLSRMGQKCSSCAWYLGNKAHVHRGVCEKFKYQVGAMLVCDEWED